MPTALAKARYRGKTGKIMLAASIPRFDPTL
jgi:hypothetical protein